MAKVGGGGGRGGGRGGGGGGRPVLSRDMSRQERANALRNLTVSQYFRLLRDGLPQPRNPKHARSEQALFRERAGQLRRLAEENANARRAWNREAAKLGGERGRRMQI